MTIDPVGSDCVTNGCTVTFNAGGTCGCVVDDEDDSDTRFAMSFFFGASIISNKYWMIIIYYNMLTVYFTWRRSNVITCSF